MDKIEAIKNLAVKMGLAHSTTEIEGDTIVKVLENLTDNYAKPFDLHLVETGCTITITRNSETVSAGTNQINYEDVLTVTATADEGKAMSSLTINGMNFTSGQTYTVSGDVVISGTAA